MEENEILCNSSGSKESITAIIQSSDPICRICLDIGESPLISPCKCSGTSGYAHEHCLKTWILTKFSDISLAQCEVCKTQYLMRLSSYKKCKDHHSSEGIVIYFCSLPFLILILLGMFSTVLLSLISYYTKHQNLPYTIVVLLSSLASIVLTILLLLHLIYKGLIDSQLIDLTISSFK
jgi:hypothetical protein